MTLTLFYIERYPREAPEDNGEARPRATQSDETTPEVDPGDNPEAELRAGEEISPEQYREDTAWEELLSTFRNAEHIELDVEYYSHDVYLHKPTYTISGQLLTKASAIEPERVALDMKLPSDKNLRWSNIRVPERRALELNGLVYFFDLIEIDYSENEQYRSASFRISLVESS